MAEKTKSVGAQLREARQARGWTSKAAAKATKIKEQQLLNLESEDYAKFAAPAYVRGFVRIYAKTLGLNEVKILQELDRVLAVEGDDVYLSSSPVQYMPKNNRKPVTFRGLTLFLLILVGLAVFGIVGVRIWTVLPEHRAAAKATPVSKADKVPTAKAVTEEEAAAKPALPVADEEKVAKAVAVSPPAPPAPAEEKVAKAVAVAPAPAPAEEAVAKAIPVAPVAAAVTDAPGAGAKALVLQARSECWVRVTALDGGAIRVLSEGVMKAGEERDFPGEKFVVKMADPSAMTLIYNGKSVALGEVKVPTEYPLP